MSKNTNLSFLTDYITADITNGRIGINNASPTVAFDVVGATKITGNVGIGGSPSNGLIPGLVIGDGTDNKGITLFGTSTTQQNIAFTRTANSQQGLIQYDHTGDYMRFFTATSERMRITSAGNVGIGTTSPSTNTNQTSLTINGTNNSRLDMQVSGTRNAGFVVASDAAYLETTAAIPLVFYTNSAERMRITSGGLLQMSNNSTTFSIGAIAGVQRIQYGTNGFTTEFQFFGSYDGYAPIGASAFNTRSDYRLKEDLKEFSGLSLITDMKVYDFKWKEKNERNYGFMAHELQEIVPYVVTGTKDGMFEDELQYQGVDYSKLVPVLVKAIQELSAEITIISNKIK